MNQNHEPSEGSPEPKQNPTAKPGPARTAVPKETQEEIVRLHAYYGTREIALRVGWSRKIVRRILSEQGCLPPPQRTHGSSKLDPFRETIEQKVKKGLTVTRILREISEQGYSGGRSILSEHVRAVQKQLALQPHKSVKRRFETAPGEEMQIDWSPYRIPIAGKLDHRAPTGSSVVRFPQALGACLPKRAPVHATGRVGERIRVLSRMLYTPRHRQHGHRGTRSLRTRR